MSGMVTAEQEAAIITRERLKWLSIGYYVSGGMGALLASFFLIYVIAFGAMSFMPTAVFETAQASSETAAKSAPEKAVSAQASQEQARAVAVVFRIVAGVMGFIVLCGWVFAGLTIYSGHCLQKRRRKTLILVMGILNMIWIPYGTLLGIATLMTINTEAAKREFGG